MQHQISEPNTEASPATKTQHYVGDHWTFSRTFASMNNFKDFLDAVTLFSCKLGQRSVCWTAVVDSQARSGVLLLTPGCRCMTNVRARLGFSPPAFMTGAVWSRGFRPPSAGTLSLSIQQGGPASHLQHSTSPPPPPTLSPITTVSTYQTLIQQTHSSLQITKGENVLGSAGSVHAVFVLALPCC